MKKRIKIIAIVMIVIAMAIVAVAYLNHIVKERKIIFECQAPMFLIV